jgi:drug/metabolite transporter (DMT)-like permease
MGSNATGRPLVWTALVIVYIVWGSTYLGIKIAVETMPPMLSGAMRFVTAALLLGGFLLLRKGLAPFRMTLRQFAGAGLVGLLLLTSGNGLLAIAEQHMSSGLAALLVASVPLWLVLFRIAVRDRPGLVTLAGVLVGFGGVAALSLNGGGESTDPVGIVIVLLGSLSWSIGSFLSARIPMPPNAFAASMVEMLFGGVGLVVASLALGERVDFSAISGRSWLALAYLVLVGSLVGFTAYSWLLGNAPISLVSTYAYVNPAVAVGLGAAILGERVTWQMAVGGLVILLGVALVISTERTRSRRARADAGALREPPRDPHSPDPVVEQSGV